MSIKEVIKKRRSIRNYSEQNISDKTLSNILSKKVKSPFKTNVLLKHLPVDPNASKGEKIGTYGFVKGHKGYIVGVSEDSMNGYVDLGYVFEKTILDLTKEGLGTCWMAGTFDKKKLLTNFTLKHNQKIPAITPIGYKAEKLRTFDKILKKVAKPENRFESNKLFFNNSFSTPLKEKESGNLRDAFEMVRLAPSAKNAQPWRLVKIENKIHFYIELSKKGFNDQSTKEYHSLDAGIAMCHFEHTLKEDGITGSYTQSNPKLKTPTDYFIYISTFEI